MIHRNVSFGNKCDFTVPYEGFGGTCVFKELVGKLPSILAKEKAKIDLVVVLGGAEDIVNSCPLVGDQVFQISISFSFCVSHLQILVQISI